MRTSRTAAHRACSLELLGGVTEDADGCKARYNQLISYTHLNTSVRKEWCSAAPPVARQNKAAQLRVYSLVYNHVCLHLNEDGRDIVSTALVLVRYRETPAPPPQCVGSDVSHDYPQSSEFTGMKKKDHIHKMFQSH